MPHRVIIILNFIFDYPDGKELQGWNIFLKQKLVRGPDGWKFKGDTEYDRIKALNISRKMHWKFLKIISTVIILLFA